jgi:hypothetical protein
MFYSFLKSLFPTYISFWKKAHQLPGIPLLINSLFSPRSSNLRGIIIVSGVGRSGTTATLNAIAASPGYRSAGTETPILKYFARLWGDLIRDKDYILSTTKLSQECLRSQTIAAFLNTLKYPDGGLRFILKSFALNPKRLFRLHHRPKMVLQCNITEDEFENVMDLLPETKIIWVIRNAVDTVASRQQFHGFNHESIEESCYAWTKLIDELSYQTTKDNAIIIKYEELQTPTVAQKIETFLNISSEHWTSFLQKNVFHPTLRSKSEKGGRSVNVEPRDSLSQHEQNLIGLLTASQSQKLGYAPTKSWPNNVVER